MIVDGACNAGAGASRRAGRTSPSPAPEAPSRRGAAVASIVLCVVALARMHAADVPGVLIAQGSVTIRSTHAHGAVISIAEDVATQCHRITVDGVTGEVPFASTMAIHVDGSAGGGDQLTVTDPVLVIGASLFGTQNQLAVHQGAICWPNLVGDEDRVDATGGTALITVSGGTHNTYAGNYTINGSPEPWTPSALPGLFTLGFGQILVVSSDANGTICSIVPAATPGSALVTLDGHSVTIPAVDVDYVGSAGGGDAVQVQGFGGSVDLWGSGNRLSYTNPGAVSDVIVGGGNTVTSTGAKVGVTIFGPDETLTGVQVIASSPIAPAVLPAIEGSGSTAGTGSGAGSASAGTTSGTATGAASGGGAASSAGGGGGGCGVGGSIAALGLILARLNVRRRTDSHGSTPPGRVHPAGVASGGRTASGS